MAMSRETIVNAALAIVLLAAPLMAWMVGETFYVTLATRMAVLALAAVGLNLALGLGGLVSFGHAAFFGIGGYAAGILSTHALNMTPLLSWPFEIGGSDQALVIWLVAILAAGLAALVTGAISLRTSGVYFIMNPLSFFLLSYGLLMLALALFWSVQGSRFGAALQAARQNEQRVAAVGITAFPVRLAAFVISAMITGLAGALYADLNRFASPSMLSWQISGELIVLIILGGTARLFGPVAGAMAFVLIEYMLGGLTERWQFFLGLILLGVVLFARGGIVGALAGKARHG